VNILLWDINIDVALWSSV